MPASGDGYPGRTEHGGLVGSGAGAVQSESLRRSETHRLLRLEPCREEALQCVLERWKGGWLLELVAGRARS